jgi:hypothetical protein
VSSAAFLRTKFRLFFAQTGFATPDRYLALIAKPNIIQAVKAQLQTPPSGKLRNATTVEFPSKDQSC